MKAVIYARVSSPMQAEDGTIQTQLDHILHDPVVNARYGDPRAMPQYLDDGVSGRKKPLWTRPAGKRLLEDAKAGEVETVICYKFGRLGRKAIDTEQAIEELLACGVTIYDAKSAMTFDNNSAASKMLRQILGITAEFEVNNDVEAIRDGMERVARSGDWRPHSLRLGYDWASVDEKGRKVKGCGIVVNEPEADLVRRIFTMRETMSQAAIAHRLNEEGIRLPRKAPGLQRLYQSQDRPFRHTDIHRICSAEEYTGWLTWGRTTKVPGRNPVAYTNYAPELQIVATEQFNQVQAIMSEAVRLPHRAASSNYVYSALLRCPNCAGTVTGTTTRIAHRDNQPFRRYVCRAFHMYGRIACKGWSAFEHTVDKAIIPFVADLLENRLGLSRQVEAAARAMVLENAEGTATRLKGQVAAAEAQLKNVQRMAVEGLMTVEDSRPFILEARETIERSKKQLETLEQGRELRADLAAAVSRVSNDVQGALTQLEPKALQAVVRQVFESFTIGKDGRGKSAKAWIESYQFRAEVQALLPQHTSEQPAPLDMSEVLHRILEPLRSF